MAVVRQLLDDLLKLILSKFTFVLWLNLNYIIVHIGFNSEAAKIAGYWRDRLNRKGTPIGVYDLQIASIAIVNNLTLSCCAFKLG